MLRALHARWRQGYRTYDFPKKPPILPDSFRGRPVLTPAKCLSDCQKCIDVCPTDAIVREKDGLVIDMGRCLFCNDCAEVCPTEALRFSNDWCLATNSRGHLVVGPAEPDRSILVKQARRLFRRSLKLRQVSAGGCNACEADTNVLNTLTFDLGRFGIQFVASPRHADGLLVTGPVTANMKLALRKTYNAIPSPKIVIAVGACAISGGPYVDHSEVNNGIGDILPVDLFIPGCPPNPWTILDGLLRMLGIKTARAKQNE